MHGVLSPDAFQNFDDRGFDMSSFRWILLTRRVSFLFGTAIFATGLASAQTNVSLSPSSSTAVSSGDESSSLQLMASLSPNGMAALPSAPSPSASAAGSAAGQDQQQGWKHAVASKYALEFSGGFNAPVNGSSPYVTWGGQFTVGAGVNFNKYVALLTEYQFIDDKLPGALIAETGADGGHAHIWSFTLDPVVSLFPKSTNDIYFTGGGGFYRKVTSFTDPEETEYCDYYYCEVGTTNVVVGHFSSNQGGWNVGAGYQRHLGGTYHESRMKLFAEVRYVYVDTPAVVSTPNGLDTTTVAAGTKLLPVSFGVRW
jgi:hypothetical protein